MVVLNSHLQIPFASSKWVTGRRRKGTTLKITSIFNTFCLPTSNFMPKFFFHVRCRKTTSTIISTSKHLVRHFLEITKRILSEKSCSHLKPEKFSRHKITFVSSKRPHLPLLKKVTLSSVSHSARRRGCTLVVNLNPAFSFINTTPAGTVALKGEMILHIPEN